MRAAQKLTPKNAEIEIFELDGISSYNQDHEMNPPEVVSRLKEKVRAADAILFVTPEYNYSIPEVLKHAIDCASRPHGDSAWEDKPVAVMGALIGMIGSVRAQYHPRQTFMYLNMHALNRPEVMIPHEADKFDCRAT